MYVVLYEVMCILIIFRAMVQLLTKDPRYRVTLDNALKHPFIKSADDFLTSSAPVSRRRSNLLPVPSIDVVRVP